MAMAKMTLDEVREAVKALTPEEQAILAHDLLKPGTGMTLDIEKAWVAESARRYQEILNGEVETIPAEQVFERIERARAEGRPVSSLI
ncbi:MAG: addiction module protein [Leptonema illini]|jgi:putative addiction module component (TIGR02574 family)|uniref:Addiction module protein n=3 Tax=Leptonema illini TaxID=183 RepID=A0A833LXJ0_9LEPT|nr:addiction module protein [Leptonema illini]KAB2932772.1 MAG: addiction module protein [Leptonema illini]